MPVRRRVPRRRKAHTLVAFRGEIVREKLPLPFVRYPRLYGAFFAFSESENGPFFLCACSLDPLHNLTRLRATRTHLGSADSLREAPLPSPYVPDAVAKASLEHVHDPLEAASFRAQLCHRCHLATPTLRWCHPMYGGTFKQSYGWYIEQAYLRLGMDRRWLKYLSDVCPPDYQTQIEEIQLAQRAYGEEWGRLMALVQAPLREDIAPDERTYFRNVRESDARPMILLRKRASHLRTEFENSIESIARQEFGFRPVGEGWVSETLLYQIVCRVTHPHRVLRHHRPDWLNGLELDIYIPERRMAIEYQGQQHFHPIEAWGGSAGLAAVRARDAKKARACKKQGILLVTIDYTEPLSDEHVRTVIARALGN